MLVFLKSIYRVVLLGALYYVVLIFSLGMSVSAQPVEASTIELGNVGQTSAEEEIMDSVRKEMLLAYQGDIVLRPSIPSLLFLPGEHGMLQAAKASFLTRAPTIAELSASSDGENGMTAVREVSLGGILYTGDAKWIVWINNQRVTPDALLSEIIDVSVFKEYIDIKWFDRQTNRIYPIRLRPNQKFNLDARMFLPG